MPSSSMHEVNLYTDTTPAPPSVTVLHKLVEPTVSYSHRLARAPLRAKQQMSIFRQRRFKSELVESR